MKTFVRLFAFACLLLLVGVSSPARSQPQFPADNLETRVAALEANITIVANSVQKLADKIDKLSDPLTQKPLRSEPGTGGIVAAVAAPVVRQGPLGFYRKVCTNTGCAMVWVPQEEAPAVAYSAPVYLGPSRVTYSTVAASDCGTVEVGAAVLTERRGPLRRALFGRFR